MVRGITGPHRLLVGLNQSVAGRALVGGKGASLSHLATLGAPVPPALALTTHAYTTFASSIGLPSTMAGASATDLPVIQAQILGAPLPAAVARAIKRAFADVRANDETSPALAVRSSATAEDSADHSFAGLHDTVLDVRSLPDLEAAVRACWASLWSERALSYRRTRGTDSLPAEIAVVIQRLVPCDVSFVAFAADPVTGSDEHVVISASWGLGEAIVSGAVTPDHIVVGRDGAVVEHALGRKETMVIPGERPGDGTREVPVPRMLQGLPVMSATQAAEIAALARLLSGRLGYLADLEGGIAGGAIHLFQARPITTLTLHAKLADSAAGSFRPGPPLGTPPALHLYPDTESLLR